MTGFIIFLLSFAGLWISIYFTSVYYKWFDPDKFWIPKICQLKEETCMTILDTPRAKMFGIPNSALGVGMFAYLILNLWIPFPWVIAWILLLLAVLRSIYLAYSLIYITKIPCPLCFTSHVINLILFIIVSKMVFSN